MKRPSRSAYSWAGWVLMSLVVVPASADEVPTLDNPYARKKAPAPQIKVHAAFARAVGARVAECYQAEQHEALDVEERGLLDEYAVDVVRDLWPALASLGCLADKPPSSACTHALTELDCASLAAPIIEAGWDCNLSPEAKTKVAAYAQALAARESACLGRAAEEAGIVQGVREDRLAVLVESEIVIGKCELLSDKAADCDAELARASCEQMAKLSEQGQLTHLCTSLLRCVDAPAK